MTFYDDPNRQCLGLTPIWGGAGGDNVPNATGATAGAPGTFTPAGSDRPANVAGMTGVVASPATPWTAGQYVQTGTAGAPGEATWTGTTWVGGRAPAEEPEPAPEQAAKTTEG